MLLRRWTFLVLMILAVLSSWGYFFPQPPKVQLRQEPQLASGSATLVIAPHEDDESLAAAGLIQETLAKGGRVQVVLVTNGDAFRVAAERWFGRLTLSHQDMINFGKARQQETLKAMDALGVPRADVTFLGYPDQGTAAMWLDYWDTPFISTYTGASVSPYSSPGRPYTGVNLLADLKDVIRRVRPTTIVYPHPNDAHVDHWGVHNFTEAALEDLRRTEPGWNPPAELLYIVHRGDWPAPKGMLPGKPLVPPAPLVGGMTTWEEQPLSGLEILHKEQAIRAYETQVGIMRRYMMSFVRTNELYGTVPRVIVPKSQTRVPTWVQVATDPAGDTFSQDLDPTADVVSVDAARDEEMVYLRLHLRGRATARNSYVVMVHGYHKETGWGPLLRAVWHPPGKPDAVLPPGAPPVRAYPATNAAEFAIPLKTLGYPDALMVGFETRFSGVQVDQTSWRLVNLN